MKFICATAVLAALACLASADMKLCGMILHGDYYTEEDFRSSLPRWLRYEVCSEFRQSQKKTIEQMAQVIASLALRGNMAALEQINRQIWGLAEDYAATFREELIAMHGPDQKQLATQLL